MRDAIVMVVDDNRDDVELTVRALNRAGVHNEMIEVVRSGRLACDYLFAQGRYAGRNTAQQPRLILLDARMADMDGVHVLHRLRVDERTCTVPVVMLTASSNPRDVPDTYRSGANSYIRKPLDFGEFNEMVNRLVAYWLRLNVVSADEHLRAK